MENNFELLPLTDDYIFKRVFAYKGNESVLKDFLEALLKIEIKGIKITNPEIIPYEKGEKRGLLDIKAEINDGTMLDVEMQMKNERNTEERATEYMGKMISEQLQVGEDYQNLKKSIVIFITNYNFLKRNSYHSIGRMKFDKIIEDEYVNMGYDKEDEVASKYIEVHYIIFCHLLPISLHFSFAFLHLALFHHLFLPLYLAVLFFRLFHMVLFLDSLFLFLIIIS